MRTMDEVSHLDAHRDEIDALALDDPDLAKYPGRTSLESHLCRTFNKSPHLRQTRMDRHRSTWAHPLPVCKCGAGRRGARLEAEIRDQDKTVATGLISDIYV
jgi:hypothetical protein